MPFLIALLLLLASTHAQAYIGPGAGLSVLGSLWTVLVGIVLALVAMLSWPIRVAWRRLRGKKAAVAEANDSDTAAR